ncbi:hypothetical protein [Jeotgalibacillus sp. JSM ZJ347]
MNGDGIKAIGDRMMWIGDVIIVCRPGAMRIHLKDDAIITGADR